MFQIDGTVGKFDRHWQIRQTENIFFDNNLPATWPHTGLISYQVQSHMLDFGEWVALTQTC